MLLPALSACTAYIDFNPGRAGSSRPHVTTFPRHQLSIKFGMIPFIIILLMCVIHIPVYAQQQEITKHTLLISSKSIAHEMGKTYQVAQNCDRELSSISFSRAAVLFQNYFEKHEVTDILKQYKHSVAEVKGKSCNLDIINTQLLMQHIADYMRMAAPFSKQKTKEKRT